MLATIHDGAIITLISESLINQQPTISLTKYHQNYQKILQSKIYNIFFYNYSLVSGVFAFNLWIYIPLKYIDYNGDLEGFPKAHGLNPWTIQYHQILNPQIPIEIVPG